MGAQAPDHGGQHDSVTIGSGGRRLTTGIIVTILLVALFVWIPVQGLPNQKTAADFIGTIAFGVIMNGLIIFLAYVVLRSKGQLTVSANAVTLNMSKGRVLSLPRSLSDEIIVSGTNLEMNGTRTKIPMGTRNQKKIQQACVQYGWRMTRAGQPWRP